MDFPGWQDACLEQEPSNVALNGKCLVLHWCFLFQVRLSGLHLQNRTLSWNEWA